MNAAHHMQTRYLFACCVNKQRSKLPSLTACSTNVYGIYDPRIRVGFLFSNRIRIRIAKPRSWYVHNDACTVFSIWVWLQCFVITSHPFYLQFWAQIASDDSASVFVISLSDSEAGHARDRCETCCRCRLD